LIGRGAYGVVYAGRIIDTGYIIFFFLTDIFNYKNKKYLKPHNRYF